MTTTHLATDPTATGSVVFPALPAWLTLSAALADEVGVIADREDLLVTIAPGAGAGAPACFFPARALIEVDGTHLGVDPATVDPANLSDRARYATTWGLLTHECGHAAHTTWDPPSAAPPAIAAAAMLLEEPRMEAAQIRRRPDDRHWLRASARGIILADLTPTTDPAQTPLTTAPAAAQAAALLLARVDGGILTRAEVAPVARVIEDVLGADTLAKLRAVWRTALHTADDDGDTMMDLGRQWCEIVGTDPNTPDPAGRAPDPTGTPTPSPSPNGSGTPSGSPVDTPTSTPPTSSVPVSSVLAGAIAAVLDTIAGNVAREKAPQDPAARASAARAAESAAANNAARAARSVFTTGSGGPRYGKTETAGTRPPTDEERTAARVLARALNTAGVRDRVPVKSTSIVPPGRLRMRGVLAADAQRAAGALPTAEPFTRTPTPTPPLRLAIACDVSGSMKWARDHVASAAWILADAARHTTVPTHTASVIFGHNVRPITRPGTAPNMVTEFHANDNWENIPTAIDALDGALGLSTPGAARLLVIVSDGEFRPRPRRDGQRKLDRLRANGCAVLWLTTHDNDTPLDGATTHRLTDPATAARAIGHAATTALRAATR